MHVIDVNMRIYPISTSTIIQPTDLISQSIGTDFFYVKIRLHGNFLLEKKQAAVCCAPWKKREKFE